MSDPAPPASDDPLVWGDDGQPRSRLFGDVYFSTEDGLAEARAVFLDGCGLPDAWAGRRRFVVGELGFGTGLNTLALLDLWSRTRPPGARLHVFSLEGYPITAGEAARAHARWPELAEISALLRGRWPGRARGLHRVDLPELGAVLDLAVLDVAEALEGWDGRADAWFLDGFSPALNPQMWGEDVLRLVGARSAPGARAATFTVAGHVRRGLAAAGFAVEKRPGYGRKRERLEARLPGEPADSGPRRVAVVGGGIAGAAAARAVRALGGEAVLVEAHGLGAGGSGNPAALVTPRLDAGGGPPAKLFAQAFRRAIQLYGAEAADAVIAQGVLQLAPGERDALRFGKVAASGLFEPTALAMIPATETASRLGEPAPDALDQPAALVVDPGRVLAAWAGDIVPADVAAIAPAGDGFSLRDAAGAEILRADAVILAAGLASAAFGPCPPLTPVRGQASWATTRERVPAAAWGGYAVPTADGLLFGATHDRGETATEVRADDHARNRGTLAAALPALAARIADLPLEGRASVRATTADRLPLAGPADGGPPGLFLLTGFGSRGFSWAPLLAEHVAAQALGAPSPLPEPLADLVDPARFRRRAERRGLP
ncbi:tRNA (5-methylaminomethyl-2-thiouridine)(34)-methyltransferase MnmD [Phenylobacterium sp. J367]|uniref:tRNA (5-methylaminomethyl-2-thiouridine)(34)-methyltransferase MnmD n=1 Tax=Phenylobacterium sp. J367 TaxID=2898435 RepID=UPI002150FFF2|nr:tRNA (5-methylaminomethyl-2-thiouridine)(34)-methyltransferase MnmD [Phenylobacterium sp. J367]MCR5878452.1 tRNA (5-methylaminomethyl-2-thiouridine)(34)-methyltransferase MnmD [Phenylobacterium sp. J367]